MLNRVVSIGSLLLAAISVILFVLFGWWILMGRIDELQGIFALGGWLLTAIIFAWRSTGQAWLDPVSIVKA
ncbi:MAG: hypothetical protein LAQ30_01775 [Acidobacteriia bacterium]|nr:hypothetical protein [Terriglobia bacterium]